MMYSFHIIYYIFYYYYYHYCYYCCCYFHFPLLFLRFIDLKIDKNGNAQYICFSLQGSEFMLTLECYDFDGQLKMAWSHFFRQVATVCLSLCVFVFFYL